MPVLEGLLAPIANSSNGCGEDLSLSNEFGVIQKSRIEDDALLDQGDWVTEPRQADWPLIINMTKKMLTESTKDLRLSMWLVEALGKQNGFEGLTHGMQTLNQLIETFWEHIHPEIDDGDQEQRITLFKWFVKIVGSVIKAIPLSASDKGEFTYNDFISARSYDEFVRRNPDQADHSGMQLTLTEYNVALQSTPMSKLHAVLANITQLQEDWRCFSELVDARLGYDAPVFGEVAECLSHIHMHLEKVTGPIDGVEEAVATEQETVQNSHSSPSLETSGFSLNSGNHVQNRQQALRMLAQISQYFQTNEPHSPVTYMLNKTIEWANLPLHEWLKHVLKDDALDQLNSILGIRNENS